MTQLIERLSTLSETLRQQQQLLARLAENAVELRGLTTKLAEQSLAQAADDPTRAHLRNVESYMARLLEETVRGRTALADELRGEFKLLARVLGQTRGAQQALPMPPPAESRPLTAGERVVPPADKA